MKQKLERRRNLKKRSAIKGAVTMEYVLLAVLIAGGSIIGIIAFSRTIMDMFDVGSLVLTGQHEAGAEAIGFYRTDRSADMKTAKEYSDSLHR